MIWMVFSGGYIRGEQEPREVVDPEGIVQAFAEEYPNNIYFFADLSTEAY